MRSSKNNIRILVFGIVAVISGTIAMAYQKGYCHALIGGVVQHLDVDNALFFYKIAYEKNPKAFMVAHDIACCCALKGDKDACFKWLRIALKSPYADFAKNWAKTENDFASVRQTPEFRSLIYGSSRTAGTSARTL